MLVLSTAGPFRTRRNEKGGPNLTKTAILRNRIKSDDSSYTATWLLCILHSGEGFPATLKRVEMVIQRLLMKEKDTFQKKKINKSLYIFS